MSGFGGGAGTGATVGTAIAPGIGTAAGAVIGGLASHFLGKNSASKQDRNQFLEGQGDLKNIFNYGLGEGKAATGEAQRYNSNILSGNRSEISQAMAPEVNAITGQANQAKRQEESMGTSRGGGTNAGNQQRQQQTQGAVSNLIAKARPEAAAAQQNLGGNLLGLGANAAQAMTGNAANSYRQTYGQDKEQGESVGKLGNAAGQMAAKYAFGF